MQQEGGFNSSHFHRGNADRAKRGGEGGVGSGFRLQECFLVRAHSHVSRLLSTLTAEQTDARAEYLRLKRDIENKLGCLRARMMDGDSQRSRTAANESQPREQDAQEDAGSSKSLHNRRHHHHHTASDQSTAATNPAAGAGDSGASRVHQHAAAPAPPKAKKSVHYCPPVLEDPEVVVCEEGASLSAGNSGGDEPAVEASGGVSRQRENNEDGGKESSTASVRSTATTRSDAFTDSSPVPAGVGSSATPNAGSIVAHLPVNDSAECDHRLQQHHCCISSQTTIAIRLASSADPEASGSATTGTAVAASSASTGLAPRLSRQQQAARSRQQPHPQFHLSAATWATPDSDAVGHSPAPPLEHQHKHQPQQPMSLSVSTKDHPSQQRQPQSPCPSAFHRDKRLHRHPAGVPSASTVGDATKVLRASAVAAAGAAAPTSTQTAESTTSATTTQQLQRSQSRNFRRRRVIAPHRLLSQAAPIQPRTLSPMGDFFTTAAALSLQSHPLVDHSSSIQHIDSPWQAAGAVVAASTVSAFLSLPWMYANPDAASLPRVSLTLEHHHFRHLLPVASGCHQDQHSRRTESQRPRRSFPRNRQATLAVQPASAWSETDRPALQYHRSDCRLLERLSLTARLSGKPGQWRESMAQSAALLTRIDFPTELMLSSALLTSPSSSLPASVSKLTTAAVSSVGPPKQSSLAGPENVAIAPSFFELCRPAATTCQANRTAADLTCTTASTFSSSVSFSSATPDSHFLPACCSSSADSATELDDLASCSLSYSSSDY